MRISITILVVALVAACGSIDARTSSAALALEQAPSGPGEEVTLVLRNRSDTEVAYNLCTARLSHQRSGQWVLVGSRSNCPADQQTLERGGQDSYTLQLPEQLEGGNYRYHMRVQVGGTRIEEIYSPTFRMPEVAEADSAEAEAESSGS